METVSALSSRILTHRHRLCRGAFTSRGIRQSFGQPLSMFAHGNNLKLLLSPLVLVLFSALVFPFAMGVGDAVISRLGFVSAPVYAAYGGVIGVGLTMLWGLVFLSFFKAGTYEWEQFDFLSNLQRIASPFLMPSLVFGAPGGLAGGLTFYILKHRSK